MRIPGIEIIQELSPNFTNGTMVPKYIMVHCIGYTNPLQVLNATGTSAHFLIPQQDEFEEPTIYEVVELPNIAWHAGVGEWQGSTRLNNEAIGIEISMPNYAKAISNNGTDLDFFYFEDYQAQQILALKRLIKYLIDQYHILPENVLGHSDYAPWRNITEVVLGKTDPGPTLPWNELAAEGLSVWPAAECDDSVIPDFNAGTAQKLLTNAGYGVPATEEYDLATNLSLGAARLRWTPNCFNRSSQLADACYRDPLDRPLACRLYNYANPPATNTAYHSLLVIILGTGGALALIALAGLMIWKSTRSKKPTTTPAFTSAPALEAANDESDATIRAKLVEEGKRAPDYSSLGK